MDEYLFVEFPDSRDIVIDGNEGAGKTNDVLLVSPGRHVVSLEGEQNFSPTEIKVLVHNTRPNDPLSIKFEKLDPTDGERDSEIGDDDPRIEPRGERR